MSPKSKLFSLIQSKRARVGVIGLGYVGLPLAVLIAVKGYDVSGFVRSKQKVNSLRQGETSIDTVDITELKGVLDSKKLTPRELTTEALTTVDIIIVCVPTPVTHAKKPDLTAMREVADMLSKVNTTGKLIINESTVAPGTTKELFSDLSTDGFLACSPERVDPGNVSKTVGVISKVVGGVNEESRALAAKFYESVLEAAVISVSSLETAEMAKMLENTYRAVNIALINEFAMVADSLGVDILEVIEASKTKWSFQAHYPGIGVGGHCIPVDPYYVLELAKTKGIHMPVVSESLEQNEKMPNVFFNKLFDVYKVPMKVTVYGLAYKKNVKDKRESPSLAFCALLKEKGILFDVYDPFYTKEEVTKMGFTQAKKQFADIFVIATDHDALSKDKSLFIGKHTVVIDGRNYFQKTVGARVIGLGRQFA